MTTHIVALICKGNACLHNCVTYVFSKCMGIIEVGGGGGGG